MVNEHHMSERHACALAELSRDTLRHVSQASTLNVKFGLSLRRTGLTSFNNIDFFGDDGHVSHRGHDIGADLAVAVARSQNDVAPNAANGRGRCSGLLAVLVIGLLGAAYKHAPSVKLNPEPLVSLKLLVRISVELELSRLLPSV